MKICLSFICFILLLASVSAQENIPFLPKNARLAIAGDSITEQRLYSKYIEVYLLACAGRKDISVFQFGWGGESASGFLGRMEKDLAVFRPNAATVCYGMNDGGVRPYEDYIGTAYKGGISAIADKLKGMGVEKIIIASPGAVDTKYFKTNVNFKDMNAAESYNENLRRLRDIAEKVAKEKNTGFSDIHSVMVDAMTKAKKALGEDYDVCGLDGVHPGGNGHLIMAYALLKAFGCDGNIGEITIDMKGQATASPGHKIRSTAVGKVEVESERYPFCFDSDKSIKNSNRTILPYLPFNQDLNRFVLKVKNLSAPKAKVIWGAENREFTKAQLESGINLTAEFANTPFDPAFAKFAKAVGDKQSFETKMVKVLLPELRKMDDKAKMDAETAKLCEEHSKMDADAKALIIPIRHWIIIQSEN